MSSDEKVLPRTYAKISSRVLNRSIKKREQQIANAEADRPTSKKTLGQLRYELDCMQNALLERAILNKVEKDDESRSETMHQVQTDEKCN